MLLFILSWAIKQIIFVYWLYLLNDKTLFFGGLFCCKFWIFYSIYFIILISMIAGNLVDIRLPKIQSRKCLRKSNLWRYKAENVFGSLISTRLNRRGYRSTTCLKPKELFSFHNVWNVLFCLSLQYLWPFVSRGVFFICNLLLSVSRAMPLTLKKTGQWLWPFLCLNCFTNTLGEQNFNNQHFFPKKNWRKYKFSQLTHLCYMNKYPTK